MPPKRAVSAKRGRPSKAVAPKKAVAPASPKVKKEEPIEINSDDEQSLGYPDTPPPSYRQDIKSNKKRSQHTSEDEETQEEDVLVKKPLAKKAKTKEENRHEDCAEYSNDEVPATPKKSMTKLGMPVSLDKSSKDDVLELFSSGGEDVEARKGKIIKPVKPFKLPSALANISKRNMSQKSRGKIPEDVKQYLDTEAVEGGEEEEEEEEEVEEVEDEDTEMDVEMEEAISSFKKNVMQGGERKRDVFGTVITKETVYMEDIEGVSVSTSDPSPDKDEVLVKSKQDKHLVKTYKGMANRSLRRVLAWTDEAVQPSLPLSVFFNKTLFPDINKEFVIDLVTFEYQGKHFNPSRVDPKKVTHTVGLKALGKKTFLSTISKPSEVGIAVSVVVVKQSALFNPCPWYNNKLCKLLTGTLLMQEDTLWESGLLMAFALPEVRGPIQGGRIAFSCRPVVSDSMISPSKSRFSSSSDSQTSLPSESKLVVLDGRKKTFNVKKDLHRLPSILSPFPTEIPYGSLALVGYVPNLYSPSLMGCSFAWVVVLATPNTSGVASSSKA